MKELIDKYLLENYSNINQQRQQKGFKWDKILSLIEKYNNIKISNSEYIRNRFRKLKNKFGELEKTPYNTFCKSNSTIPEKQFIFISSNENKEKGTREFSFTAAEIPTESEIVEHFNIDLTKYKISQIWHKTTPSGKYSISVNLQALKGLDAANYTESFKSFLDGYNVKILSNIKKEYTYPDIDNEEMLYLISLADLHIGSNQKEGYLNTLKSIVIKMIDAIESFNVAKILILNTGDFLHTNGSKEQTLKGTQLETSKDFEDAFTDGLDFITEILDHASNKAKSVTFVNVRGNHSFDTEYCLGEAIKKIYNKQSNIEILNQKDTRIYYHWNNNAFLFTHGDKGVERLPLIFATEGKDHFSKAENHHILLGHLHHNGSKQFINDRKEYAGIEVRVLGSPTSSDRYHKQEGFVQNKKQVTCLVFTESQGKYAEFNYKVNL